MKKPNVTAIILAGGIGSRMGSDITKQRMSILGKSVLQRTAEAFFSADSVDKMVFVCRAEELDFVESEVLKTATKPYIITVGGKTRGESARCGFLASEDADLVAIHDCARCLITPEMIDKVVNEAIKFGCASAACAVTDTLKHVEDGIIRATVSRNDTVRAQTPQVFRSSLYKRALENAMDKSIEFTDDNMLLELIGEGVRAVMLDETNMKITNPGDISLAEHIIKEREKKNV